MGDNRGSCCDGVVSFLVGMGIGATAAAAVALLYAPRAGEETRHDVAEALRGLRGRADELAERVRATTSEVASRLKQDFEAAVAVGHEAAAERRAELEDTIRGGQ